MNKNVDTIDLSGVVLVAKMAFERQLDAARKIGYKITADDYEHLNQYAQWQEVIDALGSLTEEGEEKETLDALVTRAETIMASVPSRIAPERQVASLLHHKFSLLREQYKTA